MRRIECIGRPGTATAKALAAALTVLLAATLLTGCATTAVRKVGVLCVPPTGRVETGVVLMAQAVPSAKFVPCVSLYPAGWTLAVFRVTRGEAVMSFDSDRGGAGALEVTFVRTCHPAGTSLPPDVLGAAGLHEIPVRSERLRQFDKEFGPTYRATRYYTFTGGCMIFDLHVTPGTESTLTTDAAIMVNLVSRSTLAAQVAAAGFRL
jgi:hypothetical protein